jgi:hypothetical protein
MTVGEDSLLNCSEVERVIWSDGPEHAPQAHLIDCSSCREEARRAADLEAALIGMRSRFATAPDELESAIIAAVSQSRLDRAREVVRHPKFRRGAALGAAAAAAAATAAFGLIAARRRSAATDLVA